MNLSGLSTGSCRQAWKKPQVWSKEQLLSRLYWRHESREPEIKIIDVFVCKLRKKLSTATGGDNYIETVWGRGYVLRDPASAEGDKGVAKTA